LKTIKEEDEDEEEDEVMMDQDEVIKVSTAKSRAERMALRNGGVKNEPEPTPSKKATVKKEEKSPAKASTKRVATA